MPRMSTQDVDLLREGVRRIVAFVVASVGVERVVVATKGDNLRRQLTTRVAHKLRWLFGDGWEPMQATARILRSSLPDTPDWLLHVLAYIVWDEAHAAFVEAVWPDKQRPQPVEHGCNEDASDAAKLLAELRQVVRRCEELDGRRPGELGLHPDVYRDAVRAVPSVEGIPVEQREEALGGRRVVVACVRPQDQPDERLGLFECPSLEAFVQTPQDLNSLSPEEWNHRYPVGTRVRFWPGAKDGEGRESVTRSAAQRLGGAGGPPVVWVRDYAACIALTHVEPLAPIEEVTKPWAAGVIKSMGEACARELASVLSLVRGDQLRQNEAADRMGRVVHWLSAGRANPEGKDAALDDALEAMLLLAGPPGSESRKAAEAHARAIRGQR